MARIQVAKLDRPRHVRVSVGFQPAVTLLSLVADGLGAKAQGVPDRWRQAVRHAVGESAGELRPVFAPHGLWIPDCLCPDPLDDDAIGSQLGRMAQTTAEDLYEEVVANFPGGPSPRWQHVIDDPRSFVAAYTRTLARVWAEFEPVWKQSRDLLHREAERIGAASVTGTLDAALATLNHPISLADESLLLPGTQNSTIPLRGRPITLIPIVSGSSASIYNVEAESVWVGYPVPGVGRLWESGVAPAPVPGRALEAVLGIARAQLLRAAERPLTMGEASTILGCVPSAVTHHCRRLEAAQLITRTRTGKNVVVRRTPTGDQLIELLATP
ncbi:ArsR/SmtB family transcription factor [Streptomyces sundarbansensis]